MKNNRILPSLIFVLTITTFMMLLNWEELCSLNALVQDEKIEYAGIGSEEIEQKEIVDNKIIIIGDSRMYAASQIIDDEDIIFIARNGATCGYLDEVAEEKVNKILEENPKQRYTIFLNLGVNDLSDESRVDGETFCGAEDYISRYKALKDKWKNHDISFISINPLDEEKLQKGIYKDWYLSNNENIQNFNKTVSEALTSGGIFYCDTSTSLLEDGYESPDGLHYTDDTTREIIGMLKECNEEITQARKASIYLPFNKFIQ